MLSQFTNCLLLFILVSFYIAVVIRFYQYMIIGENNILYKIVTLFLSLVLAPFACFYGIMDSIANSYEEENEY